VPHGFRLRDLSAIGARLDAGMQRLSRWRRWIGLPCLAAAAVIVWKGDALWQRELTALSPVSSEAQRLDAVLRADLGAPDVRYIVAVPAADRESALRGAEASVARLAPLVDSGTLSHIDAPTRLLPSEAMQRARQAALPAPAELQARLQVALQGLPLRAEKLQGFVEDVERARQAPFITPQSLAGTSLALAAQSLLVEREAPAANEPAWLALLPLHGPPSTPIDAAAVRSALAGVETGGRAPLLLDMKAASDAMYADYLREAAWLSGGAAIVIVLLLAASLRSLPRLARVVLPLAAAVLCVVGGLLLVGVKLTLLHLVGLLLVAAVGSNYSLLFDRRSRPDPESTDAEATRMLVSVALAMATTVLTFGVLAFSSVPVLGMIGSTVAPGVILAFVFAAALAQPPSR
jgi:predicted exporter